LLREGRRAAATPAPRLAWTGLLALLLAAAAGMPFVEASMTGGARRWGHMVPKAFRTWAMACE
jgi:hypothetical protein